MPSLRKHEDDFANFLIDLGLEPQAAGELADMICKFGELTDALEELVDAKKTVARRSAEGGSHG